MVFTYKNKPTMYALKKCKNDKTLVEKQKFFTKKTLKKRRFSLEIFLRKC